MGKDKLMPAERYLVLVNQSAFMQMTLATIAAFDVPKQSPGRGRPAKGNETYGLLWGHQIKRAGSSILSIEQATIDSHAQSSRNGILPSGRYREKIAEVIHSFWPAAHLIGEFHSHPYRSAKQFPAVPGFSEQDRRLVEESEAEALNRAGMRVFLVPSIHGLKKRSWARHADGADNQLAWSMGRYKLTLTAYVAVPRRRSRKVGLTLLPRHVDWPEYSQSNSRKREWVTLAVPSVGGLEDFTGFVAMS
jgi:hypothetical protein